MKVENEKKKKSSDAGDHYNQTISSLRLSFLLLFKRVCKTCSMVRIWRSFEQVKGHALSKRKIYIF